MLPEVPWIDLTCKGKCPECGHNIGSHIIKESFCCPTCDIALSSNKKDVKNRAILSGAVFYAVSTVAINVVTLSATALTVGVIVTSFGALAVGYGYFRFKFKIWVGDK